MLSNSVPIVSVVLSNGKKAKIPDWLSAQYVKGIRKLPYSRSIALESQFVGFPELLSYKIYGSMRYWRVLLMYNGISDWYYGMVVGMTLKIPELSDVEALYSTVTSSKIGQTVTL